MTDRVLPSREEAAMFVDPKNLALMDPALLRGSLVQDYLLPPLRAIASGRLVDREAIDAICDEIWELGQASWPWRDAPTPVLDAVAIGDTGE